MPTYDYNCESCGHSFEVFQYFNEEVLTECPECKTMALRRLFGTGAVAYVKGSKGFNASVIKPQEPKYKEGTNQDVKELSAVSEFGEAKNFLERLEQVNKVNEEIEKQATQD